MAETRTVERVSWRRGATLARREVSSLSAWARALAESFEPEARRSLQSAWKSSGAAGMEGWLSQRPLKPISREARGPRPGEASTPTFISPITPSGSHGGFQDLGPRGPRPAGGGVRLPLAEPHERPHLHALGDARGDVRPRRAQDVDPHGLPPGLREQQPRGLRRLGPDGGRQRHRRIRVAGLLRQRHDRVERAERDGLAEADAPERVRAERLHAD